MKYKDREGDNYKKTAYVILGLITNSPYKFKKLSKKKNTKK